MCQAYNRNFSYTIIMNDIKRETNKSIAERVGANLKAARNALRITQAQLAKELGKYQPDYCEYETGRVQLDYEKIVYLCKRLDITPNDLFGVE